MTKRRNFSPPECKKCSVYIYLKVIKLLSRGLSCIMMERGPLLSKEIAFVERILLGPYCLHGTEGEYAKDIFGHAK